MGTWPELSDAQRAMMRDLGRYLRNRREAAGLTLADLGPIVGSPSSLRHVEEGRMRTRRSRLRPWLAALGLAPAEIDELLTRCSAVVAPERADGQIRWCPVGPRLPALPRRLEWAPRSPEDRAPLGADLWDARVAVGLRRAALARRLGCSLSTIRLVEVGKRRPSLELLVAWIHVTGADNVRGELVDLRYPGLVGRKPGRR